MDLNITGFGEELPVMNYSGVSFLLLFFSHSNGISQSILSEIIQFGDWLVTYMDPVDYWKAHKSHVLCEIIFVIGGLLAFVHGKYKSNNNGQINVDEFLLFRFQHSNKVADGHGLSVPRRHMDFSWKM